MTGLEGERASCLSCAGRGGRLPAGDGFPITHYSCVPITSFTPATRRRLIGQPSTEEGFDVCSVVVKASISLTITLAWRETFLARATDGGPSPPPPPPPSPSTLRRSLRTCMWPDVTLSRRSSSRTARGRKLDVSLSCPGTVVRRLSLESSIASSSSSVGRPLPFFQPDRCSVPKLEDRSPLADLPRRRAVGLLSNRLRRLPWTESCPQTTRFLGIQS